MQEELEKRTLSVLRSTDTLARIGRVLRRTRIRRPGRSARAVAAPDRAEVRPQWSRCQAAGTPTLRRRAATEPRARPSTSLTGWHHRGDTEIPQPVAEPTLPRRAPLPGSGDPAEVGRVDDVGRGREVPSVTWSADPTAEPVYPPRRRIEPARQGDPSRGQIPAPLPRRLRRRRQPGLPFRYLGPRSHPHRARRRESHLPAPGRRPDRLRPVRPLRPRASSSWHSPMRASHCRGEAAL